MNFFNDIQQIDSQVKSGELDMAGRLQLPIRGEAMLFAVDTESKDGRNYLGFYLTLPGVDDYRKFEIRCPSLSDSDSSKYMAMQNIYKTLFGCLKRDPKTVLVDKCFSELTEVLKTNSVKVAYECEETKYIAQRGAKAGSEVSAIFLRSLSGIAKSAKINIEIKRKEQAAGQWEMAPSEEVPF